MSRRDEAAARAIARLRRDREERSLIAMGRALGAAGRARVEHQRLRAELVGIPALLASLSPGGFAIDTAQLSQDYARRLEEELELVAKRVAQTQRDAERAQREHAQTMRARIGIERVVELEVSRRRERVDRTERAARDEAALRRRVR